MSKSPGVEPSPEFVKRYTPIMRQWEAGTLPFEEVLKQFDVLRQDAIHEHHYANQAQIEIMIGVIYGFRGELDLAIQQQRAARMLFEQAGNRERMLLCDTNIAEAYQQKGNLVRARQIYNTAYVEAKRIRSIRIQAVSIANIGRIAMMQGAPEQARPALEEAEQLTAQLDNENQKLRLFAEIYINQVSVYLQQNEPQHAWDSAQKGLQSAQKSGDLYSLGRANRSIAEVLITLKTALPKVEEGVSTDPDVYFQTALNQFGEIKADYEIAHTLSLQGQNLAKRGQLASGARKVQQAARIFERLGLAKEAARATELQSQILMGGFQ